MRHGAKEQEQEDDEWTKGKNLWTTTERKGYYMDFPIRSWDQTNEALTWLGAGGAKHSLIFFDGRCNVQHVLKCICIFSMDVCLLDVYVCM